MFNPITDFSKFNCYTFYESDHKYFWYDKPVKRSVTQFVSEFFEPFDLQEISKNYALKNQLNQEDVINEWDRNKNISCVTGTIVHKFLEDYARGKVFDIDFSEAKHLNIEEDVKQRLSILLPQAEKFHYDTLNKLIPIQCEYTVGIDDIIAGNIDLLCWNVKEQEFQIWDYKNLKEMTVTNNYNQYAKFEFSGYKDCKLVHYSMQQNFYKVMLERKLNIRIGKCYLVHFCLTNSDYEIYQCIDMYDECSRALDRIVMESK